MNSRRQRDARQWHLVRSTSGYALDHLIVGAKDPMLDPAETIKHLTDNAPQTEVLLLQDTGHALVGQTGPILGFLQRTVP